MAEVFKLGIAANNNQPIKEVISIEVELEGIELCRPCRHLTEMLDQKNILKEFMRKGGLRCQILSSSKINVGDKIEIIN